MRMLKLCDPYIRTAAYLNTIQTTSDSTNSWRIYARLQYGRRKIGWMLFQTEFKGKEHLVAACQYMSMVMHTVNWDLKLSAIYVHTAAVTQLPMLDHLTADKLLKL